MATAMTKAKAKFTIKIRLYDITVQLVLILLFAGLVYNYAAINGRQLLVDPKTLVWAFAMQLVSVLLIIAAIKMANAARDGVTTPREQKLHITGKVGIGIFLVFMLIVLVIGFWMFLLTVSDTAYRQFADWFTAWPLVADDQFRKSGYQSLAIVTGLAVFLHFLGAQVGYGVSRLFAGDERQEGEHF